MKSTSYSQVIVIFMLAIVLNSCSKNDNDISPTQSISSATETEIKPKNEINDFIYRAMKTWYFYKDEQPLLADDQFQSTTEKNAFIDAGGTPEEFFNKLKAQDDRFSSLDIDENLHRQSAKGVIRSIGFEYQGITINRNVSDAIVGVVYRVLPGSTAQLKGIKRGDTFTKINGIRITKDNFSDLIRLPYFSLGMAIPALDENGNIYFQDKDQIALSLETLKANYVPLSKILFPDSNIPIGYLLYTGFDTDSETDLNNAFAEFKTANIQELVLDLRYNPGGLDGIAASLGSMVTGQFTGKVFLNKEFNSSIQSKIDKGALFISDHLDFPDKTQNGAPLNSLGLHRIYVITTKQRTRSAAELFIKCMEPYIDVIVIGNPEGTYGKGVATETLYDSTNLLSKNGINPRHNYVLDIAQVRGANANGDWYEQDFGIAPTITARESPSNLGILGHKNENLLNKALTAITGQSAKNLQKAPLIKFGE